MGQRIALEGVVLRLGLSLHDDRQPPADPACERQALRPGGDPKSDRRRYFILTHGSHLVDTARFLGGPIAGSAPGCSNGSAPSAGSSTSISRTAALGHLDLQIPVRGDFQEGFQIHGEHGSVSGRVSSALVPQVERRRVLLGARPAVPPRPGRGCAHLQAADRGRSRPRSSTGRLRQGRPSTTGWPPCRRWSRSRGRSERGDLVRLDDVTGGV